ncbi:hypothetical protein [Streptomyces sp. YIM B13518]|uniref:hypothetical protein n=1 Tax=Streptomyces sp. YIM B13518 TaxID=3366316 RepID=UPI0036B05467
MKVIVIGCGRVGSALAGLLAADWAVLAGLGTLPLLADEARKGWLRRRADRPRGDPR